jgi:hypothetical protein
MSALGCAKIIIDAVKLDKSGSHHKGLQCVTCVTQYLPFTIASAHDSWCTSKGSATNKEPMQGPSADKNLMPKVEKMLPTALSLAPYQPSHE